ncbi:putative transmembrane protein [Toxoplasma gondii TgCatPRC2]|uniref:Transmembrane protein n=10 Tax=Toxoplasma gondii TaxID=5811 RepID=A0A125YKD8_TOXGM|nr:hypothetical protein TGME49_206340 [Toxoplasma gondii ME49]ESS33272.1 putative transmembrane protein [Toxoplasma gondii VEG]KFG32098.1 putative transmembrane protein [Toxoplasma gondii GAB2-2007-GAL-DOM2]KFG33754.1 putative transmembrane protein [Toxoplasma gondii p89]KFG59089.1 putative transmembrane protein [Toxoplasma gondii RUB]KFH00519.1 putative transmembrane protein [Toxoplasma gondii VAND]KFH08188.1 putative transmembrane protein [Toxoplasma gondii MAS]KYK64141.1 putative transmem|eukprot:XP_002367815.1 hypothetical protein TGME49_206340 [Toxoplasma gondii ME49]
MDPRVAHTSGSRLTDRSAMLVSHRRGLVGGGCMVCLPVVLAVISGLLDGSLMGVGRVVAQNSQGLAIPSSQIEAVIRMQSFSTPEEAAADSWKAAGARAPGEIRVVVPEADTDVSVGSVDRVSKDTLAFSRHENAVDIPMSFWDEDTVDDWGDADDDEEVTDFMPSKRSFWSLIMPGFSGLGTRAKY